ncbi:uncharacterized protein LOC113019159 [Astatotilapia calliptera]|uniref:uncharacterized protein LOC113019159 n=1 Tax=Astatotilapia calliptera TaxID=8154 RepID=UPI000E40505E|nr:uncharacterized protein LOC113019159 [Astatotilapia calliptera]
MMSPATTNPVPAGQAEENHTQNQTFSQASKSARDHPTAPPPVPPKKKHSALFKERLERFKAELQPKLQMTEGKNCEVRACRPENVSDVMSANTQTSPAAADVSPKDNPTQLDHAAEAELSTWCEGEGTRPHVFSQGNADFNKGETRSQPKTISGETAGSKVFSHFCPGNSSQSKGGARGGAETHTGAGRVICCLSSISGKVI